MLQAERTVELFPTNEGLTELKEQPLEENVLYLVHIFKEVEPIPVQFVSSNNEEALKVLLDDIVQDEEDIALHLECYLNKNRKDIALFEVGTSKGALLIQNKGQCKTMMDFLLSHTFNTREFDSNKAYIKRYFGCHVELSLIDVKKEYLAPKHYSFSFKDMVNTLAGMEISAQFKNPQVTWSKWHQQLNLQQMCYAAYIVIGLHRSLPAMRDVPSSKRPFKKKNKFAEQAELSDSGEQAKPLQVESQLQGPCSIILQGPCSITFQGPCSIIFQAPCDRT